MLLQQLLQHFLALLSAASATAAFASGAAISPRQESDTIQSDQNSEGGLTGIWSYYTTTYTQTQLHTLTTTYFETGINTNTATASTYISLGSGTNNECNADQGDVQCGSACCKAGEYCSAANICIGTVPPCANPCGYQGFLCCEADEICYTDANGQAQCLSGPLSNGGAHCGLSTTTYQFTSSYQSTIFETITLVVSRVETGVETIVRTASFHPEPAPCATALGQSQCGDICCSAGQVCQSPGLCTAAGCAPLRPTSGFIAPTPTFIVTVTASYTATETTPFQTPLPTSG